MAEEGLWVFGYGSLMWRPDFPYVARTGALLYGAHRSLCVYSHVHRGTRERPGLVLGLNRGGACRGAAFLVAPESVDEVIAYLRGREQVTAVYREARRPVRLDDAPASGAPAVARALCYLVDRRHEQYAGELPLAEQARLVRQGEGRSGPNGEYVLNTLAHLEELGIRDSRLAALGRLLREPE